MSEAKKTATSSHQFKAEIKQILEILIHSLYKERDIFLRELISNAADALTRLHFEMLVNQDVLDPEEELAIHVDPVEIDGEKWLVVKDAGIGMTSEELVQNLGTVAQSGAREFLETIDEDESEPIDIIGQFGVGFYSTFMVASEVRVVSRSYRPEAEAAVWVSEGGDSFRIESAEKAGRGTEIHLKLRESAIEFADEWTLRQTIKRHSDYVSYPIYVGDEQANQLQSLWRKTPSEVTADEYKQFYQQFTMDFEESQRVIHFSSDAPLHIRALLFVPGSRERGVLNLRKEPGLQLYSHNILIQEYNQDILPRWLSFVDGVVDSEDLPLNVSRETIQNTRLIRQLGRTIRKRILREFSNLASDEPDKYELFWKQYGSSFKEGLSTDPDSKDEILPFLRFYSSTSDGALTTLDAYVERMPEEQEEIYYLLGDDSESIAFSPHLDPFLDREIEVLFFVDSLDPFITPIITEYEGHKLRNIDDPELELPDTGEEDTEPSIDDPMTDILFNQFVGRCVTTLGDRITEVRPSTVLKGNPARLVSPKDQPGSDFQRIYRYMDQDYQVPKKDFEINRRHPLIQNLTRLVDQNPTEELINLAIEQLYENALIIDGLHPNPAGVLPRVQRIMELAVQTATYDVTEEE